MKNVVLIFLVFVFTACMENFDPEKDSNIGTIELVVDLAPVFSDIIEISDFDTRRIRVRAYCYSDEGLLKETQSYSTVDIHSPITFRFRHLEKGCEYKFLAFADLYEVDEHGSEVDCWFHLLTGSMDSFYINRVNWVESFTDIIGMAQTSCFHDKVKSEQHIPLCHAGTLCHVVFTGLENAIELYHSYTGLSKFSPTGNEKYISSATYSVTETVLDTLESVQDYYYIITDTSGETTLRYRMTLRDGSEPIEYSNTIVLTAGKKVRLEINCLNGELKCTDI